MTYIPECREAFVSAMRKEFEYKEAWSKPSMKAHHSGKAGGFQSDYMQARYRDFCMGWEAAPKEPQK